MAYEQVVQGGAIVTQPFGCTWYQLEWSCPGCPRGMKWHAGIDLAARGSPTLLAVGYGTVVRIGRVIPGGGCGGLGPFAVCVRSGPVDIWYGHASRALVSIGTPVTPGLPLAQMGTLGCSTGNHVHLEVQPADVVDGCRAIDPGPYLTRWPGANPQAAPPAPASSPPALGDPGSAPWWLLAGGVLLLAGASRPAPSEPPASSA